MEFMEMTRDEILKKFEEIYRRDAFYSDSAGRFIQKVFGKVDSFYCIDQIYYNEDPENTSLSEEENIRNHWFQDMTFSRTKYLYKALKDGLITEEVYKAHADEEIVLSDSKNGSLKYILKCPKCRNEITIYSKPGPRPGGYVKSCPFCGGISISGSVGGEGNPLILREDLMGGTYLRDNFTVYPEIENETPDERKERIVSITLNSVKDIEVSDKKEIIESLYERNPYVMHIAYDILKKISEGEDRTLLNEVKPEMNGNQVLSIFGYMTKKASGLPGNEAQIINIPGALFGLSMGGFTKAEPVNMESTKEKAKFCRFCGAKVNGKFCSECGTKVED
ncbi:MAG: zinc ribbon domain-containing protein [Clostridia bacterium]|nr:zinc ribbon domain-containing protein [Clostridia bacterium]